MTCTDSVREGSRRMDYTTRLESESLRVQNTAAWFLRSEGAGGYRHLPALLAACCRVDPERPVLSWDEVTLLNGGAWSMGAILNAVGCDLANSFHRDALSWLMRLTNVQNPQVVAGAIYGLEQLGSPPIEVRDRLCELIIANRRPLDHPVLTARALAFRVLSRIDRNAAQVHIGGSACKEYLKCIDYWIDQSSQDRKDALSEELFRESQWLTSRQ